MKERKRIIILFVTAILLVLGLIILWRSNKSQPNDGKKSIVVEFVDATVVPENKICSVFIETDKKYLSEELENVEYLRYEYSDYGMYITGYRGLNGDDKKFWMIYEEDESGDKHMSTTGASEIVLEDKARYILQYEEY